MYGVVLRCTGLQVLLDVDVSLNLVKSYNKGLTLLLVRIRNALIKC